MEENQQIRQMVDWLPRGPRVNQMIAFLNDQQSKLPPQEMADLLASSVASVAFMMLETNSIENVKALFCTVIDDAQERRAVRTQRLAVAN